ncbi:hypothetical protein [Treponema putidum]|uniref:hypothetical protein n=1 Tax=Treponema putidum TaxID=221027 RepID=UPI003D8C078A
MAVGELHPEYIFQLRVCINSSYGRIELRVLPEGKTSTGGRLLSTIADDYMFYRVMKIRISVKRF